MTARLAVVDDDRSFTELLHPMLGTRGYAVDVYHSGSALLEALRAGATPNVVLLDVLMPGLDGLEVLERIRAEESTRLVPVVMLTSSSQDEDKLHSYRLGANSYVRKPVEFGAFVEAVSSLGLYWVLLNRPPPVHAA